MYVSARHGRGRKKYRGGLGLVSTMVGNSLVLGSSPIGRPAQPVTLRTPISRPVGPAVPVTRYPTPIVAPVTTGRNWWGTPTPISNMGPTAYGSGGYGGSSGPNANNLATAQALLQSNPALLTQSQWTLLQQAGLVAGTVPYSDASQVNTGNSAIDPATGIPYATELAESQAAVAPAAGTDIGTMLSTEYGGIPLYVWLGGGVAAYFMFSRSSGGRR